MAPLEETCRRLNEIVLSDAESDLYLTMALARVGLSTGQVDLCCAGHPSPVVQRRGGSGEFLEMWSTPIGLIDCGEFATASVRLGAGDRLILYSDGLTECPAPDGALLDEDGLAAILSKHSAANGLAFVDGLLASLAAYRGESDFPDDVSAAVVQFS